MPFFKQTAGPKDTFDGRFLGLGGGGFFRHEPLGASKARKSGKLK
jgi:hypothetical protein